MKKRIQSLLEDSIAVKKEVLQKYSDLIAKIAQIMVDCYRNNKKVVLFGNGGSAADAQHIACELVGRFKKERRPFPAIALTTDTSILTALANDYGFDFVFARQVDALVEKKDVVIAITTSGNSLNVIKGVESAIKKGARVIVLTGTDGGKIKDMVEDVLIVPSSDTPTIQEAHITIGHILCRLVEEELSP